MRGRRVRPTSVVVGQRAWGTTGVFVCPNHGARFDANGAVTQGPATTNLQHYEVAVAAGQLTVKPASLVAAAARTPAA